MGGNFVLPKDSGLGRSQHVLLSCAVTVITLHGLALPMSSCRFGASLDVADLSTGCASRGKIVPLKDSGRWCVQQCIFSCVVTDLTILAGIVTDFMLLSRRCIVLLCCDCPHAPWMLQPLLWCMAASLLAFELARLQKSSLSVQSLYSVVQSRIF